MEKIKDWESMQTHLKSRFDGKGSEIYEELSQYQQDIAKEKYGMESPLDKWDKSFEEMLKYFEKKYNPQIEKTCLHRMCGECRGCMKDYGPITPEHPVNNYSCKNYYEVHIGTFNVIGEN